MKKMITYSVIFLATFLFGCNSTSTSTTDNNASNSNADNTGAAPNEDTRTSGSLNAMETLVSESQFVFAGQLESRDTRISNQGLPHTFLTYRVDEVIKGKYDAKTYSISHVGGFFGDETGKHLTASNAPDVADGEQAILMVDPDSDTGCTLVFCFHGHLLIEGNNVIAANGSKILLDENNLLKFVSDKAYKNGQYKSELDKMTVGKVISYFKDIAARTGNQNKIIDPVDINVPFDSPKHLFEASPAPDIDNDTAKTSPRKQNEGSAFDQWEVSQVNANGGNPVLTSSYMGEDQ